MTKPRMWWAGDEKGWMIDSENGLTPAEISRASEYTLKVQCDRFLALMPGERKDECARTIQALRAGRVTQNIVGVGDHVLFDSYKSNGRKMFDFAGRD